MVSRRTVLVAVAGLLCAAAVFAIGVLLVGHFGRTEARIIGTTAVLVAMSLLALPSVVLVERHLAPLLAEAGIAAAAVAAGLGVAAIWTSGDSLAKTAATAVTAAAFGTQAAALYGRRNDADPPVVHRLYLASLASAVALGTMVIVLTWAQFDSPGYGRVMGSVAILDALLVALQPLLARLQPPMTPRPR